VLTAGAGQVLEYLPAPCGDDLDLAAGGPQHAARDPQVAAGIAGEPFEGLDRRSGPFQQGGVQPALVNCRWLSAT
jgi:hypothetical protein